MSLRTRDSFSRMTNPAHPYAAECDARAEPGSATTAVAAFRQLPQTRVTRSYRLQALDPPISRRCVRWVFWTRESFVSTHVRGCSHKVSFDTSGSDVHGHFTPVGRSFDQAPTNGVLFSSRVYLPEPAAAGVEPGLHRRQPSVRTNLNHSATWRG